MRKLINSGRTIGLLSLCALLSLAAGCNKLLSGFNLDKAKDRVTEARENLADQFTKDALEATQAKITQAEGERQTENYDAAAQTAKEAAADAKQLLEQTKIQYANFLREEANRWIDIANRNNASSINADKYQAILAENDEGLNQIGKEKWERSITIFKKVIADIDFLLKNLENEARAGYEEAKQLREDLVQEGAQENAPEYVEKMNQHIVTIENLISRENRYRNAISQRDRARQDKLEGVIQTKKVKSQKLIVDLENLLEEATTLGADLYALQNYRAMTKEFTELLRKFYDSNYDTVLVQAPEMRPRVEALILETKMKGAEAKMDAVQTAINNLTDGKARVYLPGSVEQLEALLAQAKQQYDATEYMESQKVSARALDLEQKIIQDFDDLAQQQIGRASDELAKAEGVYGRMEQIFDKRIEGPWVGEEMALENSKHALKEELRAAVNNARVSLSLAQLKREDKSFAVSIETAKEVAATSDYVQAQTFRVVAHNAILEIANALTGYERDGGRQYAAAEVDTTYQLLEDSKRLLHEDRYRDAVRRAADTQAQLEILAQELERVAVGRIQSAQAALATAKENRAEDFQGEAYTQAMVELDRARTALEGAGLKEAIESAGIAESIAQDASTRALRSWAEEFMAAADQNIEKARAAGAERYAPDQMQAALELRRSLQQLYDQGSYLPAVDVGRKTLDASGEAFYAMIIRGENAIAAARQFGAWDHEPKRLTEAQVSLKYAREALEAGDYPKAELHAANAIMLGEKLQIEAKRGNFNASMTSLQARLDEVERKGAGYYQTNDVSQILGEMNMIRAQFSPENYDDASRRLDQLEAQLGRLVERTPDVLRELVLAMQDRLAGLEAQGANSFMPETVDEVQRKIKYAQIDFRAEKYRPSFMNIKDAEKLLDQLELNLAERQFDSQLTDILKDFTAQLHRFGIVLDMGSSTLLELMIGDNGRTRAVAVVQESSPSDLRQSVIELANRVRGLKAPYTRTNQRVAAERMFATAKAAASNFEKLLILDQYSIREARDIIQTAFQQIVNAQNMRNDIQAAVEYPQVRFQPKGVERVVSVRESM